MQGSGMFAHTSPPNPLSIFSRSLVKKVSAHGEGESDSRGGWVCIKIALKAAGFGAEQALTTVAGEGVSPILPLSRLVTYCGDSPGFFAIPHRQHPVPIFSIFTVGEITVCTP
jgi:hypothetical protein